MPKYNTWEWREFWKKIREDQPYLASLHLGGHELSLEETREVAAFLKGNLRVTCLYFRNNRLGDERFKILIDALLDSLVIEELLFYQNALSDGAMIALAELLKRKGVRIKKIVLKDNQITTAEIEALAPSLANNASLIRLDLDNNQINDEGAGFLISALQTNFTLMDICLFRNPVKEEVIRQLKELLKRNWTIRNECNPIKKNNLIGQATGNYQAPSLLNLGIFAVNRYVGQGIIPKEHVEALPAELLEKLKV